MKKNYRDSLIIIIILFIFGLLFWKDYFLFHQSKSDFIKNIETTKTTLQNFSTWNIKKIEQIEIARLPDKQVLNDLIEKIDKAKYRVYIEAYIFTLQDLADSLIRAKKRWLDVKIIMEKNVYKAWNINNKIFNLLAKNSIETMWSNSKDYPLNHSKFLIIDDEFVLSTWNFTYSSFTKNREFLLFINDQNILQKILSNFFYDFQNTKNFLYDDNLVLSPYYSREKIEFLIKNAKNEILLYFPYFSDEKLMTLLEDKLDENINIKIITDKQNEDIEKLKNIWFEVKVLEKTKEHAKVILVDKKIAYIWSINFSTYSLDKNKETWIMIINENIIKKLLQYFQEDFK